MLVIRDTHIGELSNMVRCMDNHLRGVHLDWLRRGGATVEFAERNVHNARGHLMVSLTIDGKNQDNGMRLMQLAYRLGHLVG